MKEENLKTINTPVFQGGGGQLVSSQHKDLQ